jgi:hypothetical protein
MLKRKTRIRESNMDDAKAPPPLTHGILPRRRRWWCGSCSVSGAGRFRNQRIRLNRDRKQTGTSAAIHLSSGY